MSGISRVTGQYLSDIDHVKQSIAEIITTPIGSRIRVRDFGSDVYKYRDRPINNTTISGIYNAIAIAIDKWEPRVKLAGSKFNITTDTLGNLIFDMEFIYKPDGEKYSLGQVYI